MSGESDTGVTRKDKAISAALLIAIALPLSLMIGDPLYGVGIAIAALLVLNWGLWRYRRRKLEEVSA